MASIAIAATTGGATDWRGREADGKGHYEVDVTACRKVLGMLPEKARQTFEAYLLTSAAAVRKKGREYQAVADAQERTAVALESAARARR